MATFDLGRVTPIYKGDYSASASYELNDVVLYNGNLYWHVKATATVGVLPTDTTVWKLAFTDEGVREEIRGYADDAQASANSAQASRTAVAQSASQASESATQASTYATNASASATEASASATNAEASATQAQEYAEQAEESAEHFVLDTKLIKDSTNGVENQAIYPLLGAFPTDTAQGAIASFTDGADEVPLKSLTVGIDPVQSGSGDPSPDNVRPISGWSVVNVGVSGKNLFDSNFSNYTKPYDYYIRPIKLESDKRYVIKAELVGTVVTGAVFGITKKGDKYSEFVPYVVVASSGTVASFEFTADGTFTSPKLIVYASGQAKFDEVMSNYNITLEVKADQNPYEPYKGTFHTISLGQTVYGGTLDVVSGELVIDHKGIDMGDMNWALQEGSGTQFNRFFASEISADVSRDNMDGATMLDLISPIAKADKSPVYTKDKDNSMCVLSPSGALYVICSEYATAAEFKTAVTGMMLVYRLANPLTIQLTPHEVRSLLGQNNIFADTGDTSVEYRADPTLYISKKIAEAISALS